MVDGEFFDKLNYIGKNVRKRNAPFGEIQIILTGDFFQLPPVTKGNAVPNFVFEAESWEETIGGHLYNLEKVFRQKDQSEHSYFIAATAHLFLKKDSLICLMRCALAA